MNKNEKKTNNWKKREKKKFWEMKISKNEGKGE